MRCVFLALLVALSLPTSAHAEARWAWWTLPSIQGGDDLTVQLGWDSDTFEIVVLPNVPQDDNFKSWTLDFMEIVDPMTGDVLEVCTPTGDLNISPTSLLAFGSCSGLLTVSGPGDNDPEDLEPGDLVFAQSFGSGAWSSPEPVRAYVSDVPLPEPSAPSMLAIGGLVLASMKRRGSSGSGEP